MKEFYDGIFLQVFSAIVLLFDLAKNIVIYHKNQDESPIATAILATFADTVIVLISTIIIFSAIIGFITLGNGV